MKRLVSGLMLATAIGGVALSAAAPASAHEYEYGHRSNNSAAIGIGAGLLGLVIGSSLAQNRSYNSPRSYYAPNYSPYQYYAQPRYYPQPSYSPYSYYSPPSYGYGYTQPSYGYDDEEYGYGSRYGYPSSGGNLFLSYSSDY